MAGEEPNKKGRRTPWIRYEREYGLSAGHMDWSGISTATADGFACLLDDASRKILAADEYEHRSADAAVELLRRVLDKFGHIRRLREVVTDHGSEFYANKRDKNGNARHRFEKFCRENGIRQILCRYNHPPEQWQAGEMVRPVQEPWGRLRGL